MTAAWILYGFAVALPAALAALAFERVFRSAGWPARWPWAASVLVVLALPLSTPPAPVTRWVSTRLPADALPPGAPAPAPAAAPHVRGSAAHPAALRELDRALRLGWISSSAALLLCLLGSHLYLRRQRRSWREGTVAGTPLLVSADFGPAALAGGARRIVLPEWLLDLHPGEQALVVAHEREHVRTGDPYLLHLALLGLVLMPWNLVLWWQVGRLRLAMEVDCDRRVLRGHPDVGAYARVLLEVGKRSSRPLPVAAFSRPSSLERRVRHMIRPEPVLSRPRRAASALAGAALLLAACEAPQPVSAAREPEPPVHARDVDLSPHGRPDAARSAFREEIARFFPLVLAARSGRTRHVSLLLTREGAVERAALGAAAPEPASLQAQLRPGGELQLLESESFAPGTLGPDAVVVYCWGVG